MTDLSGLSPAFEDFEQNLAAFLVAAAIIGTLASGASSFFWPDFTTLPAGICALLAYGIHASAVNAVVSFWGGWAPGMDEVFELFTAWFLLMILVSTWRRLKDDAAP